MSNDIPNDDPKLEDLLNVIDEVEETLDPPVSAEPAQAEPEPEKAEAKPEDDKTAEPASDDDGEGDMSGLPPALHARVKSAREKEKAAKAEAAELRAKIQALEEQNLQNQAMRENGEDFVTREQLEQINYANRLTISRTAAAEKHGQDVLSDAEDWAYQQAQGNALFAQQVMTHPNPAQFAIEQFERFAPEAFKMAKSRAELAQFGGDIDALIAARTAQSQTADASAMPAAGAIPGEVTQQPKPRMPGNFGTTPSAPNGNQKAAEAFTPLTELLKQ